MDAPHAEVEIKPQLKSRDSAVKEEDPKPSHQLYKLQIKSAQLGRHCVYEIYKRSLRAPTKENTLVLITVDIGGKKHRSRIRLESELPLQQIQSSAQCWRAS